MKIALKIMAAIMALTLITPFLRCWISSASNDIYAQPDEAQSYSDLFYESSENDGLLYDLGFDENSEVLSNEFKELFSTLSLKRISPFMSAVVRCLSDKRKNRYASYNFNIALIDKSRSEYDDSENEYNEKVRETVEKSQKICDASLYKVFDKAYLIAEYLPDYIRLEDSYDDNGGYVVYEISAGENLQKILETKKYADVPFGSTYSNPYIYSLFRKAFGIEAVISSLLVALLLRKRERQKYGLE